MANKMKTHKGLRKRVRVTASGKIKHRRTFTGHLMSGKSGDRCRRLRQPAYIHATISKRLAQRLGVD
jgi:large subunit ribosomal protein L35